MVLCSFIYSKHFQVLMFVISEARTIIQILHISLWHFLHLCKLMKFCDNIWFMVCSFQSAIYISSITTTNVGMSCRQGSGLISPQVAKNDEQNVLSLIYGDIFYCTPYSCHLWSTHITFCQLSVLWEARYERRRSYIYPGTFLINSLHLHPYFQFCF